MWKVQLYRCKVKVLEGAVFLSLIEMPRLTISWVDSFYWNCYQCGLNSIYPQSLCSTPCTINLILSPAQRRAADDVMMPLSANYITWQLLLIYWLFKTITNIHWDHQEKCHKPYFLNKCTALQPSFEYIFVEVFTCENALQTAHQFLLLFFQVQCQKRTLDSKIYIGLRWNFPFFLLWIQTVGWAVNQILEVDGALRSFCIIHINYTVTLMGKNILCYHCRHYMESGKRI